MGNRIPYDPVIRSKPYTPLFALLGTLGHERVGEPLLRTSSGARVVGSGWISMS